MCVCVLPCRVFYAGLPVVFSFAFFPPLFSCTAHTHTGWMMGDFWVPSKNFNGTFLLFLLSLLLVALFLLPVAAAAAAADAASDALLVAPLAAAFIE